MRSTTVHISLNDDPLKQIDQIAREEARSRSELIREAARAYIGRKDRWEQLFAFAEKQAKRKGVREQDVAPEIAGCRRGRAVEWSMRAVLDTDVLISGPLFGGNPRGKPATGHAGRTAAV